MYSNLRMKSKNNDRKRNRADMITHVSTTPTDGQVGHSVQRVRFDFGHSYSDGQVGHPVERVRFDFGTLCELNA